MKILLILNIIILSACSTNYQTNEQSSIIIDENLQNKPENSKVEYYVHKCPNFKISEEFKNISCH